MYNIRKYNGEKYSISDLFYFRRLVGKRKKSMQYMIWEYLKGNAETLLAEDKGKIVGQYSARRYDTFFFGKRVKASLSFDTGTHPDYRKQGIFHNIGKIFFEEEGKQDVHFSTGFPNENFWTNGKNKFGWKSLFQIPLFIKYSYMNEYKEYSSKYKLYKIVDFNKEFDKFSESFKDDIPIYLDRNSKYLNWRYVDKPNLGNIKYDYHKLVICDKKEDIAGFLILKEYVNDNKKTMQLVDFLIKDDKDLYNDVLNIFIDYANNFNCVYLSLYVNPHTKFAKFLKYKGFSYVYTDRVYIVRANNDKLDPDLLFDKKNHYITMGDCDVI